MHIYGCMAVTPRLTILHDTPKKVILKGHTILVITMMQGKQGFSKQKTIMIGVQVFIAALAAEIDKDIKHLVYNPVGQQCSD